MKPALRTLLDLHDDATGFEVPGNDWSAFPHKQLAADVLSIQRELLESFGLAFYRDPSVQDASYHAELSIRHLQQRMMDNGSRRLVWLAIRFSNFGRLFSIRPINPLTFHRYPVDAIRELVTSHGWTYVPAVELEELYDGRHAGFRDGRTTWWTRFFDYV
jgi:hypothetical protein